ncbi:unnamed protein product, partial [Mesorhabditis spiculigera]
MAAASHTLTYAGPGHFIPMARFLIRQQEKLVQRLGEHNIPGLRWLVEGFNYYDKERVKEVGPDRAAAEWIVRCGGSVKFDKMSDMFSDYNALVKRCAELDPRISGDQVRVTNIEAIDASVTGYGCRHFEGLNAILDVRFVRCKNLHDFGLKYMSDAVGSKLKYLEIDSCPRVTEDGLDHLKNCTGLKSLLIHNLPRVYGKPKIYQELRQALPKCEIHYPDYEKDQ